MLLLLKRPKPDSEMHKPSQNASRTDLRYSIGMCKLSPSLKKADYLLCSLASCTFLNEL